MDLTEPELNLLASLVRQAIRKADRNREALFVKYGDETDFTRIDGRIAALEAVYRQLGKDPENITCLEPSLGDDPS